MNYSGLAGGIYTVSEWIVRFLIVNLLWIAFNIPIVFLALNILFIKQIQDLFFLLIPIMILMPILFFPATSAMFASVRDWMMKGKNTSPLMKSYLNYYKENYKKSLIGGLIFTTLWVIWIADFYLFFRKDNILMILFILLGIILFAATINFFSFTVHCYMTLFHTIKSSFLLTAISPLMFIMTIMNSAIILYISFAKFNFLLPFFTGSIIAFVSFFLFYQSYTRHFNNEE